MDRQSQILTLAFTASFLLHATLLAVHFSFPSLDLFSIHPNLDVVLVNSKSTTRPFFADAVAQSNLDGGGNTDKKRRAKTPLPALNRTVQGDALVQANARQQQLETETRKLYTEMKAQDAQLAAAKKSPNEVPPQPKSGAEMSESALAIAKLEAQIAQQMDEYQQRPKKAFVGARAMAEPFAQYAEDWRIKIERVGTLNYPEAAKGKSYGSLQLTVEIRSDGTIDSMRVERSSGIKILDEAAKRIVRMSAPFPAFPPVLKDTQILVITKTWTFSPGDRVSTE
jgi:periplasmic protein TonB